MQIIIQIALFIIGLFMLWLSSERSILYSTQTARLFSLSNLFIGFVILALSTGLPELFVAIQSVATGTFMLALGDIIGANLIDISLGLGISALFFGPIGIENDYKKQLFMLIISALVMAFIFMNGHLTRPMSIVLLTTYIAGTAWLWKNSRIEDHQEFIEEITSISKQGALLRLAAYLALVSLSAKITVDNALSLAEYFQIPLDLLGASILAVGTSLPEISLNIQAVRSKNYSLAIGNSLGSVFSQGALILGTLAAISPTPLALAHLYPIIPSMFASYGIIGFHLVFRKKIGKISGALLIGLYILFLLYGLAKAYLNTSF